MTRRGKVLKCRPKSVQVGRIKYKVKYLDKVDENDTMWGHWDSVTKLIKVNKNQTVAKLEQTFLHEVIHAVDYCKKIGLSEKKVRKLESGLYKFFKDNGIKLVKK